MNTASIIEDMILKFIAFFAVKLIILSSQAHRHHAIQILWINPEKKVSCQK
jgi:hypothetical protein